MEIIDVLTRKIIFSGVFQDDYVAVFWERENCIANFPEGVISLADLGHPYLIDIRTGKMIARIATDDVMARALDEKYEGFDVFSQSPEGKRIIALANSLVKSNTYWKVVGRESFCPPQWQFVIIASEDKQGRIHQIEVYRVASH